MPFGCKCIAALAATLIFCTSIAVSEPDPLGTQYIVGSLDPRHTSSLFGDRAVYLDPSIDPLNIDSISRMPDPEHTQEYINVLTGGSDGLYAYPYSGANAILAGNWRFDLGGNSPRSIDMVLIQSGRSVYAKDLASQGQNASGSGQVTGNVLELDLNFYKESITYRCTLTLRNGVLEGNYIAYVPQTAAWSGKMTGTKLS
jgi:hypothetical protein